MLWVRLVNFCWLLEMLNTLDEESTPAFGLAPYGSSTWYIKDKVRTWNSTDNMVTNKNERAMKSINWGAIFRSFRDPDPYQSCPAENVCMAGRSESHKVHGKSTIWDTVSGYFWALGSSSGHLGSILALQAAGQVFQEDMLKDVASKRDPSGTLKSTAKPPRWPWEPPGMCFTGVFCWPRWGPHWGDANRPPNRCF